MSETCEEPSFFIFGSCDPLKQWLIQLQQNR